MLRRTVIQVTYLFARAETLPCVHQHVQARWAHHVLRTVPVFPELQDYPESASISPKVVSRASEPSHKKGCVRIRTCGSLYQKWRKENKYWTVPDGDVPFSVEYMDTDYGSNSTTRNSPVVLTLHGSPGSFTDFSNITKRLNQDGVRVISPRFPDIWTFKMGRFRHTPEEKREYIKDFLKAIDVPRIDLLICHSSALFPALLLCLEDHFPQIKALTMLNPTAFDMPRVMRPFPLIYFLCRAFEFPVGHEFACVFGKLLAYVKPELKDGHGFDHILAALTMVASGVPKRRVDFEKLLRKDFPVMLAFSDNDRLISKKALYNMAKMIVGDESHIQRYDRDGLLQKAGGTNPSKKVLAFEKGTHFVFKKHHDVLAEEIKSFLNAHYQKQ